MNSWLDKNFLNPSTRQNLINVHMRIVLNINTGIKSQDCKLFCSGNQFLKMSETFVLLIKISLLYIVKFKRHKHDFLKGIYYICVLRQPLYY